MENGTVLHLVFEHVRAVELARCEAVSTAWRDVIRRHPRLWSNLTLDGVPHPERIRLFTNLECPSARHKLRQWLRFSSHATTSFSLDITLSKLAGADLGLLDDVVACRHVASVALPNCSVGAAGLRQLARSVAAAPAPLQSLVLCGNGLGAGGADARSLRALGAALREGASVTALDLSNNQLGPMGVSALADSLATNSSLSSINLSRNVLGEVRERPACSTREQGLDLVHGFAALAEALRSNTSLTCLDLSSTCMGPIGAAVLAAGLGLNTSLTSLNLLGNCVKSKGRAALLQLLEQSTTLTTLCGVPRGAKALNLARRDLRPADAQLLAAELPYHTSLTSMNIAGNRVGPKGSGALALALTPNARGAFLSSLRSLDVSANYLGDDGAWAVAKALSLNTRPMHVARQTSLTTLRLARNCIGPGGARAVAGALMADAQGACNSLRTLDLSRNPIGVLEFVDDDWVEGFEALGGALAMNTSLTALDLSVTFMGSQGASSLVPGLEINTSLKALNLDGNRLGQGGAEAVLAAVCRNGVVLKRTPMPEPAKDAAQAAKEVGQASSVDISAVSVESRSAMRGGGDAKCEQVRSRGSYHSVTKQEARCNGAAVLRGSHPFLAHNKEKDSSALGSCGKNNSAEATARVAGELWVATAWESHWS